MRIEGKIVYESKEYPATFWVDRGEQNEESGFLAIVEKTTAPDELTPWSFYVMRNQTKYTVPAGVRGTPIIDVTVEIPREELEKVF